MTQVQKSRRRVSREKNGVEEIDRIQNKATPVPPLHSQWQSLDLVSLLAQPTAFISIGQNNSLYHPHGAQSQEKQWERPSLENTIRVVIAAREAGAKFFWIGYDVFRQNYSKTPLDEAQYRTWYEPSLDWSEERKRWDRELVDELKALRKPEDIEFLETAHQSSFIGTALPLYLNKWGIRTLLLTGIHLDWCVEGNARTARDFGFMPIVIGDACACQDRKDEAAALKRINTFFAPTISTDTAVQLLSRVTALKKNPLQVHSLAKEET